MKKLVCLLLTLIPVYGIFAQTLTRGPYGKSMTNSSVKIMWRTSVPSPSTVKYGFSPDLLNNTLTDTTQAVNHTIKITGLNPKATYYYSVGFGAETLAGTNEQHHFTTAPSPGDTSGFKFWVTGDFGAGNNEHKVFLGPKSSAVQCDRWLVMAG